MGSRRDNGDGSIYKRADGRWEAKICINGKRRSFYGDSKAEVRKKLAQVQAEITTNDYLEETNMTVGQWLDEWLRDFVDVKASTWKRYELDCRIRFKPVLGKIKLKDLTALTLQKTYRQMLNQGLSPKSVVNAHGTLHEALKRAVKMGYIKRNVAEDVDLPKVRHQEMRPLKDAELVEFLAASADDRFADVYYVAVFTGMRQSELVGLTVDCLDFEKGTIRVYRQYVDTKQNDPVKTATGKGTGKAKRISKFTTTKNDKERIIEPAPQVMERLKEVLRKQMEMRRKAGKEWSNPDGFVFTNPDGSPINCHTLFNHFKSIVRGMGLEEVRFHDLRHTFATLSIQNGTDIKTVSSTLGHATVAFTMDKYGHVSNRMRLEAAQRMSRLISEMDATEKDPPPP